jgi:integrase
MALYKRSETSPFVMDFQYKGQRVSRSSEAYTLRDARKAVDEAKRQIDQELAKRKTQGVSSIYPLSVAIERAFEERWKATDTGEETRKKLEIIQEILGDVSLSDITVGVISSLRTQLAKERGVGSTTINRYMAALKTLLNMAYKEWAVLGSVPFIRLTKETGRRDAVQEMAFRGIVAWLRGNRESIYADLTEILYETGLRLSEALGLTYRDNIQFDLGFIVLSEAQTKDGEAKSVPLSKRATEILQGRQTVNPLMPFSVKKWAADRNFKAAVQALGLSEALVPHCLRHTAVTRWLSAGASMTDVAQIVGHSTTYMTERYGHIRPEHLKRVIALVDVVQ